MNKFVVAILFNLLMVVSVDPVWAVYGNTSFEKKYSRDKEKAEQLLAQRSERGCCVLHKSRPKCASTPEKYCKKQAEKAGVSFDFYKGKSCREIKQCPKR